MRKPREKAMSFLAGYTLLSLRVRDITALWTLCNRYAGTIDVVGHPIK
jgi:hypothetical protein